MRDVISVSKIFIDRKDRKFWVRMSKSTIFLIYHRIFILSNFFKKHQIFVYPTRNHKHYNKAIEVLPFT